MNLGLLKLQLFYHGVRGRSGLPSPLANPFGLVHLVLPGKMAVSVHLIEDGSPSPFTLTQKNNDFFLEIEKGETIPVTWTPPLKAYQEKTSSGILVSDILTVHGSVIAVHPSYPCRFGESGLSCRYCGSSKELSMHPPFKTRDLIEAIQIVENEKQCDLVHLSSGSVTTADGGVEWLTKWVEKIRKHLNLLISLDLVPPLTNDWIERTYAIGVDALYYDSDFFSSFQESSKDRERRDQRQLEALVYASKIFPKGAVLSHLVIGFDSLEQTQKRMNQLIECGVIPVLTYFPPYEKELLKSFWQASPESILPLYAQLYEELKKRKVHPHWIEQFDVILTPLEGRFFSKTSPGLDLTLQNFYETRFGRSLRLGLASLRRHLRVREVPVP